MTDLKSFKMILSDGKLIPSSKTKNKNQNPYDFFTPYNYFNAIPETKVTSFTKVRGVGIVFKQNILHNIVFYTNKNHSAGNTKSSIRYKISDNKYLTKIMYSLYLRSYKIVKQLKTDTWILSAFQEVFTKKEPKLHDAVYVIIDSKETKTIEKIKKMYPNIQIINK